MDFEIEKAMEIINFVVTGSRVYGPSTLTSDLDIVLYCHDAEDLEKFLLKNNIDILRTEAQEQSEYSGFYFSLCGIPINIIVVKKSRNMELWKKKTEAMRNIAPIKDKLKRVDIFQKLVRDWEGE